MAITRHRVRTTGTDRSPQLRYIRAFDCDGDDLWELITTPEALSEWLGATILSDAPHGEFVVSTGATERRTGLVTACLPPHYFQAAWDEPPHPSSTLLVDVIHGTHRSDLILTHGGITPELVDTYESFWTARLDRLTQYVEARRSLAAGGRPRW
ncbi:SRPBCC domain-containing protein [Kribbella sp. NPDC051586]|uniref:SRPBCC domain-containing protein n=1 Tax=Kribbella sp. NPDC051586 TaxID=3364118 RepID=UPI0037906050